MLLLMNLSYKMGTTQLTYHHRERAKEFTVLLLRFCWLSCLVTVELACALAQVNGDSAVLSQVTFSDECLLLVSDKALCAGSMLTQEGS